MDDLKKKKEKKKKNRLYQFMTILFLLSTFTIHD